MRCIFFNAFPLNTGRQRPHTGGNMILSKEGLQSAEWKEKGYVLPQFDFDKVCENTKKTPFWIHFGAGNI